jgi:hypothetical protein
MSSFTTPRRAAGRSVTRATIAAAARSVLCALALGLVSVSVATAASGTGPVNGGQLTGGQPVTGVVSTAAAIEYTFAATAGKHVTLAITNPTVSPKGYSLEMQAYNSSGADISGDYINSGPTEIDFTPTSTGTMTVVISPYQAGATGRFTLTYATDVTGALTSGLLVTGELKYGGQHTAYTFTAVAGKHVTLAITNPAVSPTGYSLQMQVYDSHGATDAGGVYINSGPTEIDFTPTAAEAGTTTVVISPYQFESIGSFTLTYAIDVTGTLTSGVPTNGPIEFGGQHAVYTFDAVAGQPVTLGVTNPKVSPSGYSLQIQVYDSSGNNDASGVYINTGPTAIQFTPTSAEAGATTVVISPYQFEGTGRYTLTYTAE